MIPANRDRMLQVIGRAVRTGLFPGGVGQHGHDHASGPGHGAPHGTNDAGVDTLPTAAIPGTASTAPPAAGLPRRERFQAALEALAGVVHEARSIDEAADVVAGLASRLGSRTILGWTDEAMALPGMTAALQARGVSIVDPEIPRPATRGRRNSPSSRRSRSA